MNRRTLFLIVVLFAFFAGASNIFALRGSGNVITEAREVKDFDRVSVSGFGELNIIQTDDESLTVEADDNLMKYIKTKVRNRVLRIYFVRGVTIRPSGTIRYNLAVKSLTGISISGSCEASAPALSSDSRMEISISGSGDVDIDSLTAQSLIVDVSGSGKIAVGGQVVKQETNMSGSGEYDASDLKSQEALLDMSGSGKAVVWVTNSLRVKISGSGKIEYYGSAGVTTNTSGSGEIVHLGNK